MAESENFSQPTNSPPPRKRARSRHYSEQLWPKRIEEKAANIIFATREGRWETVEKVAINEAIYQYTELEECMYELCLSNGFFHVKSGSTVVEIPCKAVDEELYRRAKTLYEQVLLLPTLELPTSHVITCRSRPGQQADPESDGEDIPDHPIIPVYTQYELSIVNFMFLRLRETYEAALKVGLYNCVGKYFLERFSEFLDLCTRVDVNMASKFLHVHNTSTGAPQPGAFVVKWSIPKRVNLSGGQRSEIPKERYADNVTYDKLTYINVITSEVKENEDSAIEAQNNEQIVGLWKHSQQAMLGLEARGFTVRPKVLCLVDGQFTMCYMKELKLNNANDLQTLARLMIAFLICVKYSLD